MQQFPQHSCCQSAKPNKKWTIAKTRRSQIRKMSERVEIQILVLSGCAPLFRLRGALFKECAEVTLQHSYRYFILAKPWSASISESRSVVPGSSFTTGNARGHTAGSFVWANANESTVYLQRIWVFPVVLQPYWGNSS
jgi:hypothetical protein